METQRCCCCSHSPELDGACKIRMQAKEEVQVTRGMAELLQSKQKTL
jgi:hypothetical protein